MKASYFQQYDWLPTSLPPQQQYSDTILPRRGEDLRSGLWYWVHDHRNGMAHIDRTLCRQVSKGVLPCRSTMATVHSSSDTRRNIRRTSWRGQGYLRTSTSHSSIEKKKKKKVETLGWPLMGLQWSSVTLQRSPARPCLATHHTWSIRSGSFTFSSTMDWTKTTPNCANN